MWKSLKAIGSAVCDLSAIAGMEVSHQLDNASETAEEVSTTLATKAATLRAEYEQSLAERRSGVVKPAVVSESETPKDIVPVN